MAPLDIEGSNCGVCIKRPRESGGNGSCPHAGTVTFLQLAERASHDCLAFRVGDSSYREARRQSAENLALNLELF